MDMGRSLSEVMKHHMDLTTPWAGAMVGPCSGIGMGVSFESMWLAPVVLSMSVVTPYAFRLRWDARRQRTSGRAGYVMLFVSWLLVLAFALLARGDINHGMPPHDSRFFTVPQLLAVWLAALPIYVLLRDWSPSARFFCSVDGRWAELCCLSCKCYNACIHPRLPRISTLPIRGENVNLPRQAPEVTGRVVAVFFSEFWEWGMMGLGSLAIPWLCIWNLFQCYNLFNEIGHWVPCLSFVAYSGCLLLFSGSSQKNKLNLQITEGWLWIVFGIIFNIYTSLFGPGAGGFIQFWYRYAKSDPTEWLFAQQHFFMSFTDMVCGLSSIFLARARVRTGIPILILGVLNWYTLSDHMQPCNLALLYHKLTGLNFLFMGIARYFDRIMEASLVMMFAGGTFISASPCAMIYLDSTFTFSATFFVVYSYHGLIWAWIVYLNSDYIFGNSEVLLLSSPEPNDLQTLFQYRADENEQKIKESTIVYEKATQNGTPDSDEENGDDV